MSDAAKRQITLGDVPVGSTATIVSVGGESGLRQHFLDMGLIPGVDVTVVKYAPMGDPVELCVRGYELMLRLAEIKLIEVENVHQGCGECAATPQQVMNLEGCSGCAGCSAGSACPSAEALLNIGTYPGGHPHEREHPGLGEGGRYHDGAAQALPEGETLRFALLGNKNCGKTTLYNALTGLNDRAGNFPGVTVKRSEHPIVGLDHTLLIDLPGVYSLSSYPEENLAVRRFLIEERPHAIINIVDATNLERNLYLTMQLLELGIPMVLALNMMDEVTADGGSVLVNELESQLGIPVVPLTASHQEGIQELMDHAVHVAKYQEPPLRQDFCDESHNGGAVHRCLHGIIHLIEDHADKAGVPRRFAANQLAQGDVRMEKRLGLDQNELETIEHLVLQMERERGLDRSACIADMRYAFIMRVCRATVVRPHSSREHERSAKIDRILTGRFTAIPSFVVIMATVFFLTFNVIGLWLQDLLDMGITVLGDVTQSVMNAAGVNEVAQSLVIDGVFGGVGSVLSFLPIIVVLFFFLSLLEDTGYMSRVAFFMDKLLRKIGLSGRSIIPMLIGFGCSVPSVMASRTLPSERDRKMTIFLTPFMSCSAKLPVYAILTQAFFPECAALVMVGLYFLGIVVGILVAFLLKSSIFSGPPVPFVMELPNYRLPMPRNVAHLLWDKAKDFLKNALTVILLATIVIWFLQTFDFTMGVVEDSSQSMLAVMAGWMSPVMAPLGLGDWRIITSLLTGLIAKESVAATMAVLFGSIEALPLVMTPLMALTLLVFCLLYTPCVAAINAVRRELGLSWALGMVVAQCSIAWIIAFAVSVIGGVFL